MSESKLKPCPFCGSTDVYETYTEEYSGAKNPEIFCNSCKVIFSVEDDSPYVNCDDDFKYRKDKTIEAWSRRAERRNDAVQPQRKTGKWIHIRTEADGNALYECSNCHMGEVHFPIVDVKYCWNCGAKMEAEP